MAEIKINSVEDILQLKDIQSMFKLFKQWGIKAPKTSNKDVFMQELVDFYKKNGSVTPHDRKTVSLLTSIKMLIYSNDQSSFCCISYFRNLVLTICRHTTSSSWYSMRFY